MTKRINTSAEVEEALRTVLGNRSPGFLDLHNETMFVDFKILWYRVCTELGYLDADYSVKRLKVEGKKATYYQIQIRKGRKNAES